MNDKHYDVTVSEKEGPVLEYEATEVIEREASGNSYFNGSHYVDRTAHDAIKNIEDQEAYAEMRYKTFLKTIFNICKLSGFYLENRLELKDLKTGKTWR